MHAWVAPAPGRAALVICNETMEFLRIGGGAVFAVFVICKQRVWFPHMGDGAALRICDHGVQFGCVEDGAAGLAV